MATKAKKTAALPPLAFSNKLVLNQWLLSLFGIDPLAAHSHNGLAVRPMAVLSKTLRDCREGLGPDRLHYFYQQLKANWPTESAHTGGTLHPERLLHYEQNIVEHTQWLNVGRDRAIEWKYFQWLSLLFVEVYLDQYFSDRAALLTRLNAYVAGFNAHWASQKQPYKTDIEPYTLADLNKLCLQNATGSGKTLLMHINYRQFAHYAKACGQLDAVSRTLLITPNEGLSLQHAQEMRQSGITVGRLTLDNNDMFSNQGGGLACIDYVEITKLGERDGPSSIATRNLGDQNLILVDEGHRGMGKAEESGWYSQRERLTEKGFAFEYSATFREAVNAAATPKIEQAYAKAVLFDYSYRFFYEDGYGKDYRIFNMAQSHAQIEFLYLTGCLLAFYQQLALYEERRAQYAGFNLEKPLWVFVGSSVSGGSKKKTAEELDTVTDIGRVLGFVARFLSDPPAAQAAVQALLSQTGADTGLVSNGVDIFHGAFLFLHERFAAGLSVPALHTDILAQVFNCPAGGPLQLQRLRGDSGELVLRAGEADTHFGLINVGDALGLSRHIEELVKAGRVPSISVSESDFLSAQFNSVKESSSPVKLLIGAKKFVEGWDCWRVSTLGLMRVGRSEGSQIIQLFGRGVRLKGWQWSLKRSSHARPHGAPPHIRLLETLNVFGIQADFMEKFRQFLADEGLPGNDAKAVFTIPMNVTHDFGHQLKIIRPKLKNGAGREVSFARDGAAPLLGQVPDYFTQNRVVVDWYPKISTITSATLAATAGAASDKNESHFFPQHVAFMNLQLLYFELERYKAREALHSLIIRPDALAGLLTDARWYTLQVPARLMAFDGYANVQVWQQIALELLKKYASRLFDYQRDAFMRPRLRVVPLESDDANLPAAGEGYTLTVDASEAQLVSDIQKLQADLVLHERTAAVDGHTAPRWLQAGSLKAGLLANHLYQPLLSAPKGSSVSISPVALNESETTFVSALMDWLKRHQADLAAHNTAIYLLRNQSRGSGIGFFEAGNFYPDFLLWAVTGKQQVLMFIEPHGISHEGPQHPKVQFHKTIKEIESRLGDPNLRLESAIVTPTAFARVQAQGYSQQYWQDRHVFCMQDIDASGEPIFINLVMALIFKSNEPPALMEQALKAMFIEEIQT